jgi:pimeloyl-ACP methyl ester carboxylesterase
MYGAPLDADEWASVTMPTLVAYGAKSPDVLRQGSRALAEVLPNAELRELEGVSHNVKMNALAPVLTEFLAGAPAQPAARSQEAGPAPAA